jgi:hypothetical protein
MGEAAGIAKLFQDYGIFAFTAMLLVACIFLFKQLSAERAARLADRDKYHDSIMSFATKSIEADKDATHALTALTEAIKSRPNV